MVQKNSHSVSAVGIEKYFHKTFTDSKIRLDRKIDFKAFEKVKKAQQVSKIRFRMSEVDIYNDWTFLKIEIKTRKSNRFNGRYRDSLL